MRQIDGDFEIHITGDADAAEDLAAFAARRGVKFVHILLDRGEHASQPMITVTGRDSSAGQHAVRRRWESDLRAAGIHPRRTKIEAAPWCSGVPESDREAAAEPPDRYFEHHVKVLLPASGAGPAAVGALVAGHGARLSRNARRSRPDGTHERFVTQRCHRVGLATARHRLDALVGALAGHGVEIADTEQEYVVFDSDITHDRGWL